MTLSSLWSEAAILPSFARGEPRPSGERNENPIGVGLLALIVEDFRTHGNNPLEPGFWAIALHRVGNARMDVRRRALRAPLSFAYRAAAFCIDTVWGIDLSYTVKLGRRVRIWHHGGIVLAARAIGSDVHIRHNTTLGVARRSEMSAIPAVGDRVDIGVGTSILGAVTIGDDCVIGANSVVVHDVPSHCTAAGAPARLLHTPVPPSRRS